MMTVSYIFHHYSAYWNCPPPALKHVRARRTEFSATRCNIDFGISWIMLLMRNFKSSMLAGYVLEYRSSGFKDAIKSIMISWYRFVVIVVVKKNGPTTRLRERTHHTPIIGACNGVSIRAYRFVFDHHR